MDKHDFLIEVSAVAGILMAWWWWKHGPNTPVPSSPAAQDTTTASTDAGTVATVPMSQLGTTYDPYSNGVTMPDLSGLFDIPDLTFAPVKPIEIPARNDNLFPLFGFAVGGNEYNFAAPAMGSFQEPASLGGITAMAQAAAPVSSWRDMTLAEAMTKGKFMTSYDVPRPGSAEALFGAGPSATYGTYSQINDATGAMR